jgi:carbamoyl-phosphate synthase large subunit
VVVNTPHGSGPRADGYDIRTAAVAADIPCITTLSGLTAVVQGIEAQLAGELAVRPLQVWHQGPAGRGSGGAAPDGGGAVPASGETRGR